MPSLLKRSTNITTDAHRFTTDRFKDTAKQVHKSCHLTDSMQTVRQKSDSIEDLPSFISQNDEDSGLVAVNNQSALTPDSVFQSSGFMATKRKFGYVAALKSLVIHYFCCQFRAARNVPSTCTEKREIIEKQEINEAEEISPSKTSCKSSYEVLMSPTSSKFFSRLTELREQEICGRAAMTGGQSKVGLLEELLSMPSSQSEKTACREIVEALQEITDSIPDRQSTKIALNKLFDKMGSTASASTSTSAAYLNYLEKITSDNHFLESEPAHITKAEMAYIRREDSKYSLKENFDNFLKNYHDYMENPQNLRKYDHTFRFDLLMQLSTIHSNLVSSQILHFTKNAVTHKDNSRVQDEFALEIATPNVDTIRKLEPYSRWISSISIQPGEIRYAPSISIMPILDQEENVDQEESSSTISNSSSTLNFSDSNLSDIDENSIKIHKSDKKNKHNHANKMKGRIAHLANKLTGKTKSIHLEFSTSKAISPITLTHEERRNVEEMFEAFDKMLSRNTDIPYQEYLQFLSMITNAVMRDYTKKAGLADELSQKDVDQMISSIFASLCAQLMDSLAREMEKAIGNYKAENYAHLRKNVRKIIESEITMHAAKNNLDIDQAKSGIPSINGTGTNTFKAPVATLANTTNNEFVIKYPNVSKKITSLLSERGYTQHIMLSMMRGFNPLIKLKGSPQNKLRDRTYEQNLTDFSNTITQLKERWLTKFDEMKKHEIFINDHSDDDEDTWLLKRAEFMKEFNLQV